MKKIINVITISPAVGNFYKDRLYNLFQQLIDVRIYSLENQIPTEFAPADLYLVATTSSDLFDYVMSFIPPGSQVVLSNITVSKKGLKLLENIPKGTHAMLVNLSANMAIETISDLNRLGVTHIQFSPVYPGMETIPDLALAITPAETRFVPSFVKKVIDIGHRVFTSNTIIEIALKLGFPWFLESDQYKKYMNELSEKDYSIDTLASKSFTLENKFEILLEALEEGVIGIDTENVIFAFNKAAEDILGCRKQNVVNRTFEEGLPGLGSSMKKDFQGKSESQLIKFKGTYINTSITPIVRNEVYMGWFIMIQRFSDEENKQQKLRLQMLKRGYASKYTFDDIVGDCKAIVKAKSIARKMARTDASILLTGESGTGKELFAHSIHNSSDRREMPFVAINCAALPDTLLESELFGYSEGAFTGAKKGGKLGLFEYAHKGTLFLDEIEGMSPNLQIKLLRVLQEKEVMRVGENIIISIDVRIIAASNENIREMVKKGQFRKDLYYRLNTLPIDIPPLRERGEDIFVIMKYIKSQIGANFTLTEAAKQAFARYSWDGNIRELRNIIEYLKFLDLQQIDFEQLPDVLKEFEENLLEDKEDLTELDTFYRIAGKRENQYVFVLSELCKASKQHMPVGRPALSQMAMQKGILLSEQEIRTILRNLSVLGFVEISRGRGGSKITPSGEKIYKLANQEYKMV